MCVGAPVRLIHVEGIVGHVLTGGIPEMVDLSLVPDAKAGDWVLNFLGTAQAILPEDEALKISAALGALKSLMAGGEIGDAFTDLEARTPELPPHLQAARDAGLNQG
jgi:hydrogenase expression/formation protein HypC